MTPEQYAASNRRYIDEWIEYHPDDLRELLEHFQAAERPAPIVTTSTAKETAMSTNPLTTEQQRRAQAVKDARAALAGGFAAIKDVTQVVVVAEYILSGIPEDEALAKAKAKAKAEEAKAEAERAKRAADWAAATRWPFYGAAPQRWYTGAVQ